MTKNKSSRAKKRSKNQSTIAMSIIVLFLFILTTSTVLLKDKMGIIGLIFSQGMFILFGLAAYIAPFYAMFVFYSFRNKKFWTEFKWKLLTFTILFIMLSLTAATFFMNGDELSFNQTIASSYNQALNYTGVGVIIASIYFVFNSLIADIGIYIFTVLTIFVSYFYLFDKSMADFIKNIFYKIKALFVKDKKTNKIKEKSMAKINKNEDKKTVIENDDFKNNNLEPMISYHNSDEQSEEVIQKVEETGQVGIVYDEDYEYIKPPVDLLISPSESAVDDKGILLKNAEIITETLNSFGIESEVVNINNGPTVTSYEVKPQSGIKVSKIVNLSNNLAMALASSSIRIEAPIPGKPYVGIEVPNRNKDVVGFRQLISTEEFQKHDEDITVAIGKDIFGKPLYAQINEMPHLLIAGATGSGKSVLMNAIIMSIIYKYSPKEVEFIMIDPKMVELKIYSGIPHLKGRKVVTKAVEATASLHEAVKEMTDRFELFAKSGARDIKAYNSKIEEDDENNTLEKLPYLVVIIDELSDLMMEASKDVENYITRLAQMGRASGVHLIIATQRPSVNVITGIIKANIPSRIAFQVASNVDSRTIIDSSGAEKLLGKGDMLYYPSKLPKPKRAQGAFVTDQEVERVVTYIKNKNETIKVDETFNKKIEETYKPQDSLDDVDELYDEAVKFVLTENTASISAIQRRFRVGYARAGRIIDQMTRNGIVSEQDGAKPRNILVTLEEYENTLEGEDNVENEFSE
ncbi:FtsK/SpoIIIE family DNA translocase [Helcococcus sueciensis]|uniref:FtsK/SpoIIIE family DNA translocase n=1 Tax=Helcococcus sueciensis TaxID=241555 RepID=UPI0004080BDB|nr:DNA translocase FtsK [Helcococcus sueciensis]